MTSSVSGSSRDSMSDVHQAADEASRAHSGQAAPNAPLAEGSALYVGQQLWFVRRDRRWGADGFVTVTKVGRKWAEIGSRHRIDIETLCVDGRGYISPGRCYRNKAEYELMAATSKAFDSLRAAIGYTRRDGVTLQDIRAAARLLRVDIGTEPARQVARCTTASLL